MKIKKILDKYLSPPSEDFPFFYFSGHFESAAIVASEEIKKPDEWGKIFELSILDPDGWRKDCRLGAKSFEEPIPEQEFLLRMLDSTVQIGSNTLAIIKKRIEDAKTSDN